MTGRSVHFTRRWKSSVLFAIVGSLGVVGAAIACKVPVFRYALERWNVDRYKMVVLIDEEPQDSAKEVIASLRDLDASTHANVDVDVIDIGKLSEQEFWQLEDFDPEVQTPHLQVFYPAKEGQRRLCWEGPLSMASARQWIDSPLRTSLQADLVSGTSAVWLLIEGEDPQVNARVEEIVRRGFQQATEEVKIPAGVIPRVGASEYMRTHPGASMDDVLRCDVPLKVDFQLRRLASDDENELAIRQMVSGLASSQSAPLLVPIFGRGRMLDVIEAGNIDTDVIVSICRYIVGECSCTVKTQNPGVDMLINTDWPATIGGEEILMLESSLDPVPVLVEVPTGVKMVQEDAGLSLYFLGGVALIISCLLFFASVVWRNFVR